VLFSTISFILGVAFAHYVVFPAAWAFFASYTNDYMTFMPKISDAFGLYSYMLLAFGVIFQMPVLVLALARMGLVTASFLWRHTKYAILIIFILAAVITPSSDVVNQSIMAGPMIVLYMLSIVIAWVFGKKKRAE
jgi:sec-independent protein translocase protein TatC